MGFRVGPVGGMTPTMGQPTMGSRTPRRIEPEDYVINGIYNKSAYLEALKREEEEEAWFFRGIGRGMMPNMGAYA